MIVKAASLVQRGKKTEHRWPIRPTDTRARFKVGARVAVQPGRSRPAVCRVKITEVDTALLGDITLPGVRAEGFRTTADFAHHWRTTHERGYTDDTRPDSDTDLVDAWIERHGLTPVWVVRFELDVQHRPRLLAPAAAGELQGDVRDYTSNPARAIPDEPEAIDAALLDHYSQDAHERFAGQPGRREEHLRRRAKSLANRLRAAAVAGDRAGLDTSAELDRIEEHLDVLERARRAA